MKRILTVIFTIILLNIFSGCTPDSKTTSSQENVSNLQDDGSISIILSPSQGTISKHVLTESEKQKALDDLNKEIDKMISESDITD